MPLAHSPATRTPTQLPQRVTAPDQKQRDEDEKENTRPHTNRAMSTAAADNDATTKKATLATKFQRDVLADDKGESSNSKRTSDGTSAAAAEAAPPALTAPAAPRTIARPMSEEAIQEVSRARKKQYKYETLELNSELFLAHGGFTSLAAMEHHAHITSLWLDGNLLTSLAPSTSTSLGLAPLTALRVLDVQNNRLTSLAGVEAVAATLEILNIASNRLTDLNGLAALHQLKTLDARANEIVDVSELQRLAEDGHELARLETLNLTDNKIEAGLPETDDEVPAHKQPSPPLFAYLARLSALKVLYLKSNPLVEATPQYRRRLVCTLPKLTFLDDRPVPQDEHEYARAWAKGGSKQEKATRETSLQERRAREEASFDAWMAAKQTRTAQVQKEKEEAEARERQRRQEEEEEQAATQAAAAAASAASAATSSAPVQSSRRSTAPLARYGVPSALTAEHAELMQTGDSAALRAFYARVADEVARAEEEAERREAAVVGSPFEPVLTSEHSNSFDADLAQQTIAVSKEADDEKKAAPATAAASTNVEDEEDSEAASASQFDSAGASAFNVEDLHAMRMSMYEAFLQNESMKERMQHQQQQPHSEAQVASKSHADAGDASTDDSIVAVSDSTVDASPASPIASPRTARTTGAAAAPSTPSSSDRAHAAAAAELEEMIAASGVPAAAVPADEYSVLTSTTVAQIHDETVARLRAGAPVPTLPAALHSGANSHASSDASDEEGDLSAEDMRLMHELLNHTHTALHFAAAAGEHEAE